MKEVTEQMKGKYYAREVDPERYDADFYLNEDELNFDGKLFIITGNQDFLSFNEDVFNTIKEALDECKGELDSIRDDVDNGLTEQSDYLSEIEKSVNNWFGEFFEGKVPEDKVLPIVDLCDKTIMAKWSDEYDIVAEVLSLYKGETYIVRMIQGCGKGDWNFMIYPQDLVDHANYLEAVYFGTGTEFKITESQIDSEEDFDSANISYVYTEKNEESDIKSWIINDVFGCSEEDVVIQLIDDVKTVKKYTYKTI